VSVFKAKNYGPISRLMINISARLNHILSTMMMAAGYDLDISVSPTENVDWI